MNGYDGLRKSAAWIDLSARGKLRLTGDDRARLLHAMSTNHVQGLNAGEGLYTFFLNDKSRILADAYVYNLGESLLLDTEPETRVSLLSHLDKYIIADDVVIEDESDRWFSVGLEGPASTEAAAKLGIHTPSKRCSLLEWNAGFVVQVSETGTSGVRIFIPIDERHTLAARLTAAGIPQATNAEARIVRLENGKPRYGEDISDRHLVHETQQLHAVHFNKGCYLGQEIVERVRSRGQVHRHLTPIQIDGDAAPAPKTRILVDGNAVGEITSAVYSPGLKKTVGLAYLRTEALGNKSLTIEGSGAPVRLPIAQNSSVAV